MPIIIVIIKRQTCNPRKPSAVAVSPVKIFPCRVEYNRRPRGGSGAAIRPARRSASRVHAPQRRASWTRCSHASNTGAVVAAALLGSWGASGASRAPRWRVAYQASGGSIVLDVGANARCARLYAVAGAVRAYAWARCSRAGCPGVGRDGPRVETAVVGEKDSKGSDLVNLRDAPLLRRAEHLNFIGNVEGQRTCSRTPATWWRDRRIHRQRGAQDRRERSRTSMSQVCTRDHGGTPSRWRAPCSCAAGARAPATFAGLGGACRRAAAGRGRRVFHHGHGSSGHAHVPRHAVHTVTAFVERQVVTSTSARRSGADRVTAA